MKTVQLSLQNSRTLITQVEVADSFASRLVGLMGRTNMQADSAMWIHQCNSIHTCFMKFPIDCVFVDKKLQIKRIVKQVAPWRLVWPIWGAHSVFEMPAGKASELNLKEGDVLHVGH